MFFNRFKKRKNSLNNLIKHLFFGRGLQVKKIVLGKARGIKMYVDPAYKFQRLIGADEREIQSLFVNYSKQCNYFFDIGASDGYYSLLYKKYNDSGEVYLFDADEKYQQIQKEHFTLNDVSKGYHLYSKMVSDNNEAQHVSLDSFQIEQKKILFKVDVEGGESLVLKGMPVLLNNNYCYLIIETHSKQSEKNCVDFLSRYKYTSRIIKNAWWRFFMAERRPLKHNRWLAAYKQNQ